MKILYLITKSNFGGAQRYVFDLSTEMKKLGHEVAVGFGGEGALATKLREAGIRTISIPLLERDVNPVEDIKIFFQLLGVLRAERPDVVHLNSSKMGGLGALAARIWNCQNWIIKFLGKEGRLARIIFTGHGWAFNEERSDLERFLIGCAHWLTIQLAHQTIAVSRKTREQVSQLPFAWHKLTVIHNGVGAIDLLSKQSAEKIIFGEDAGRWLLGAPLVIGTIAEFHKNKGLSYAIEGLAQLKKQVTTPFIFVIIGEDGAERVHLEELIAKLGLSDNVYVAGQRENAASLLSAFDIFLLPSITEAFPYAILEAGKAGLPVVATAVGGIPEVIDDMESGVLIQSKNSGEVTRALSYLVQNPERRKQLGGAIALRIGNRFSLETMVGETLKLYQEKSA